VTAAIVRGQPSHRRRRVYCCLTLPCCPLADYVGPPLFADPPLLGLVTLVLMHLTYFAANVIDGGAVQTAIAAGDQSTFQIGMQCFIPSVFGFILVVRTQRPLVGSLRLPQ
jgi:hypothetical protein